MSTPPRKLRRSLGLVDVFALSTGAMFSSGFFLLPGLAFEYAGAWMVVAYALSALLVVPAMWSKAELASALPKAGGTYYFLDRSMGPVVGTVGGLGTWVAMGLKNTFALIGMGAYLTLFIDVDITLVALLLTMGFTALNILGTKETARLQRWLVYALLAILGAFVIGGGAYVFPQGWIESTRAQFAAAPGDGVDGVLATVGLVFVSYAGLTKVTGVAEEVIRPDRNILRGMQLSLLAAVTIYVLGAWVLVMVVPHEVLKGDLTPIASAADVIAGGIPYRIGVGLIVVAAAAAFASTANAGIMSASRYLLGMGRDRLVSSWFAKVGRFRTPTLAVLTTGGFIVIALLTLDVVTVAKLASAFQLLIFALVNLAVIVMRESRIETYDPAVRTPLYPWMQLTGIFLSLALIAEMGRMPMLFCVALVGACVGWYWLYARNRVVRQGAILHWFERLGRDRFDALTTELWTILKESGLRPDDPFDAVVGDLQLVDLDAPAEFEAVARQVADLVEAGEPSPESFVAASLEDVQGGFVPVAQQLAVVAVSSEHQQRHQLVVVRAPGGMSVESLADDEDATVLLSAVFLVSPLTDLGQHLRLLARVATLAEHPEFLDALVDAHSRLEVVQLLSDDSLIRFSRKVTDELRLSRAGASLDPQPFRFDHVFLADLDGALDPEVVAFAEQLARDQRARVTLAEPMDHIPNQPLSADEIDQIEHSAHAERLARVAEEMGTRGVATRSMILPGTPWLEVVREVMRRDYDLVVVESSGEQGFGGQLQHLLRKCPAPLWVVRPTHGLGHKRVLAAVDADPEDAAAVALNAQIMAFAIGVTRLADTELHLLHAVPPGTELEALAPGDDPPRDDASGLRQVVRERLEHLLDGHAFDTHRTHVHLVDGAPGAVIRDAVTRLDIDLIVMGTVSRSGVAALLRDNTAETVLRDVGCSVLLVKPPGFEAPTELA